MKRAVTLVAFFIGIGFAQTANDPWKPADLLKPADLAAKLGEKPKMFQVGFGVLYRSKHIPGSVYAGPASKAEGIAALLAAVKGLGRNAEIVLYCGCCPFDHCPNVRPAFRALREAGFHNIKVVEMPENFTTDWIDKGYPVEGATARKS